MKIITRFNVGDKAWCRSYAKVHEVTILDISILFNTYLQIDYSIKFSDGDVILFSESKLYATEAEAREAK